MNKIPKLDITEMEERLITPRMPFMQVMEKPRGEQRNLKGNVVNVTNIMSCINLYDLKCILMFCSGF